MGPGITVRVRGDELAFKPGIGWCFVMGARHVTPEHLEVVEKAQRSGEAMLRLNLQIAEPNPLSKATTITVLREDGGKMAVAEYDPDAEPDTPPAILQGALQSAIPNVSTNSGIAMALQHRRGGVDVHARSLRKVGHANVSAIDTPLIDDLNRVPDAFIPATPRPVRGAIEMAARVARGFVLDKAASRRLGELCITAADMIADGQEFARLPYPVVWAELDQASFLEGVRAAGGKTLDTVVCAPDDRVGFLYTGHGVYSGVRAIGEEGSASVGWSPFAIRMGRPMSAHQHERWRRFMGGTDDTIDRFLWGSAYEKLDRSRRKALRHYSGIDILLDDDVFGRDVAPLSGLLRGGGAGDWKLALAILLVLIRPGNVEQRAIRMPQRKLPGKAKGKLIGLTTVTINISARKVKSNIKRGVEEYRRGTTRWHEVRGHYVHNRKARTADCIHDWREVEPDRWVCQHCEGKRTWRTYPNGKGAVEAGVVAKHYRVTSKGA